MARTDRTPWLSMHEDAELLHRVALVTRDDVRPSREQRQLSHERVPGVLGAGDSIVSEDIQSLHYNFLPIGSVLPLRSWQCRPSKHAVNTPICRRPIGGP